MQQYMGIVPSTNRRGAVIVLFNIVIISTLEVFACLLRRCKLSVSVNFMRIAKTVNTHFCATVGAAAVVLREPHLRTFVVKRVQAGHHDHTTSGNRPKTDGAVTCATTARSRKRGRAISSVTGSAKQLLLLQERLQWT